MIIKKSGDVLNDGNFYVYSNFKNDGLFTYTDLSDGRIFFIGSNLQSIEGAAPPYFQNIEFNNTSSNVPFRLASTIVINKLATFKKWNC